MDATVGVLELNACAASRVRDPACGLLLGSTGRDRADDACAHPGLTRLVGEDDPPANPRGDRVYAPYWPRARPRMRRVAVRVRATEPGSGRQLAAYM